MLSASKMPYIKVMNVVEILILSQSETKGKFNTFPILEKKKSKNTKNIISGKRKSR